MLRDFVALIIGFFVSTAGVITSIVLFAKFVPEDVLLRSGDMGVVTIIIVMTIIGGFLTSRIAHPESALILSVLLGLILVFSIVMGTTGAAVLHGLPVLGLFMAFPILGGGVGWLTRRRALAPKKAVKKKRR